VPPSPRVVHGAGQSRGALIPCVFDASASRRDALWPAAVGGGHPAWRARSELHPRLKMPGYGANGSSVGHGGAAPPHSGRSPNGMSVRSSACARAGDFPASTIHHARRRNPATTPDPSGSRSSGARLRPTRTRSVANPSCPMASSSRCGARPSRTDFPFRRIAHRATRDGYPAARRRHAEGRGAPGGRELLCRGGHALTGGHGVAGRRRHGPCSERPRPPRQRAAQPAICKRLRSPRPRDRAPRSPRQRRGVPPRGRVAGRAARIVRPQRARWPRA